MKTSTALIEAAAFYSFLTLFGVEAVSSDQMCPNFKEVLDPCPQGCYDPSGPHSNVEPGSCEPVGLGYFSPLYDNNRYPCAVGTFSDLLNAQICSNCPAGTYSSISGSSSCSICPSGYYSAMPQTTYCTPCNPKFFDGEGANGAQVWEGEVYCVQTAIPAETLTGSPTVKPSPFPTSIPTPLPTSGVIPVTRPNVTTPPTRDEEEMVSQNSTPSPTLSNETSPQADALDIFDEFEDSLFNSTQCMEGAYDWHGECTECPSQLRSIVHPLAIMFVVVGTIVSLGCMSPLQSAIVWMGIEFLQLTFFVGLLSGESSNKVLEYVQLIGSIFSLELDAGLSMQCLLGISPAMEQVWILGLPVVLGIFSWILAKIVPVLHERLARWMTIILLLGHYKLITTSLEALHCSGNTWLCYDPPLSSYTGLVGLSVYGVLVPLYLLWVRFSQFYWSPRDTDSVPQWSLDLPFCNCWWWPAFWMTRKIVLAVLPFVTLEEPTLTLTGFLVALMVTEFIQRIAAPLPTEDSRCNKWFRLTTADTVMQASLIGLIGASLMSISAPADPDHGDLITTVLFLALWIPTFLYWVVAMIYVGIKLDHKDAEDSDDKSNTSTSTGSSKGDQKIPVEQAPDDTSIRDLAIRHNLSLIPRYSPDEDVEMDSIASFDNKADRQIWRKAQESSSRDPSVSAHGQRTSSSHHHLVPYTQFARDDDECRSNNFQFDDASTLTDLNTYGGSTFLLQPGNYDTEQGDTSSPRPRALLQTPSGDTSPHIFTDSGADDEDIPASLDDDEMTEVWIDAETGQAVEKRKGTWADATTGLPANMEVNSAEKPLTARWKRPVPTNYRVEV